MGHDLTMGHPIPLSVDALMAEARKMTGIDLIDDAVREPLSVLHRALCDESRLHARGALAMQDKLLRLLSNRLRMIRDYARHPEIEDEPITAPLVIYGLGRSGTTKTQKILASSRDFNYLPFWQAFNPALLSGDRSEPPQPRIDSADSYCRWFDAASPESKSGHPFMALEPEEDSVLVEGSFVAPFFLGYSEVPGYMQWLASQDPTIMFEFLRDALKYIQWQGLAVSGKPWLLKAPGYFGAELELLKVFPEAKLVMTHRSPLNTIPSICKLANCFHLPYSDHMVDALMLSEGFGHTIGRHLAVRQDFPELPLLDISFEELHDFTATAAERIYDYIGLPLSSGAMARMRKWEEDNPPHKHGRFTYSLADYGLTEQDVRQHMRAYFQFMGELGASA